MLDPDEKPDHRGRVPVHLRELAVQEQRAQEDKGVWAGGYGGWRGDGRKNNLHHPSPD